ncbi:hypothetical protein [Haloferula rosea]|uniref:Uncharacterized protein n=1 Tax=Haloferula rosea TaxID=490093 RepID=A0A934RCD5_9BACT|nr:hypothetical protein [Haloferula rosea]MBK1826421.1 hypothetical protein [Haloferula rosea]
MSGSRIFTVVGLAGIFASMGLAMVGSFLPALILLGVLVLAGIGMAVGAWISRR